MPRHVGRGLNIWSNVHIADVADLFLLALDKAQPGSLFYAESGEANFKSVAQSIGRMLGMGDATKDWPIGEAVEGLGPGAYLSFGSNSRVRGKSRANSDGSRNRARCSTRSRRAFTRRCMGRSSDPLVLRSACQGALRRRIATNSLAASFRLATPLPQRLSSASSGLPWLLSLRMALRMVRSFAGDGDEWRPSSVCRRRRVVDGRPSRPGCAAWRPWRP